jgi:hypothetical protein
MIEWRRRGLLPGFLAETFFMIQLCSLSKLLVTASSRRSGMAISLEVDR